MVAPAADEAEVDAADGVVFAAVDELEEELVVGSAEVGGAALDSEEAAGVVSGPINARIWTATRSSTGSCCEARTGRSIAEATTAKNRE